MRTLRRLNSRNYIGPYFITGMSRSGTSWLVTLLNDHPDVVAFGETAYWGRKYLLPQKEGLYFSQELEKIAAEISGSADYLFEFSGVLADRVSYFRSSVPGMYGDTEKSGGATPAVAFSRIGELVSKISEKPVVVEKTPHHLMWLDRIFDAMPNTKVIATFREPYGFMLSYKHQGDRKSPKIREAFRKRYHPFACAMVWRAYALAILKARNRPESQVLILDFDYCRSDESLAVRKVQDFLGVQPYVIPNRSSKINSSFPTKVPPSLQPEDLFWLNLIAGRVMRKMGYETKSLFFGIWPVFCSVVRLPFWAVRNLVSMRRITEGGISAYLMRWFFPK